MSRSQRQQQREQRVRRRDQLALLLRVMSEPVGREYFYDLLTSCHVYTSSFGTNALAMAFREGERNVGIRIGADLTEASPGLYLEMLKEAGNVRSQNRDADGRRAGNGVDHGYDRGADDTDDGADDTPAY
jgi:hypothetical protein